MKTYKATIVPTVAGGNIEVRVSANSATQAAGLIKTLPYFRSFAKQPTQEGKENHLSEISDLIKEQMLKSRLIWVKLISLQIQT